MVSDHVGGKPSDGACARDLDAPHVAAIWPSVVDSEMFATAIVPEGDGARLPAKSAGELGPVPMLEQEIQKWFAFSLRHALEAVGVGVVDVKHLAAGLRMRDDDRMQ
jgi:hypothetical protein